MCGGLEDSYPAPAPLLLGGVTLCSCDLYARCCGLWVLVGVEASAALQCAAWDGGTAPNRAQSSPSPARLLLLQLNVI